MSFRGTHKSILILALLTANCHAGIIEVISQVESGDRDNAIGRHGELSRWQVMGYVRRDYPDTDWLDVRSSRLAVFEELRKRSVHFVRRFGRPPTDFESALLWHCPNRKHPTTSDLDYAARVVALGCEQSRP